MSTPTQITILIFRQIIVHEKVQVCTTWVAFCTDYKLKMSITFLNNDFNVPL